MKIVSELKLGSVDCGYIAESNTSALNSENYDITNFSGP